MNLVHPAIETYAAAITTPSSALLQEVEDYTNQHHPKAHMLSGNVQGRVLSTISKLLNPSFILEIGSFTGYSALCLAEGLTSNGELHTIEMREADANIAQNYFNKSQWVSQIHLHTGNATDIIPELNFNWDLVFIDADKATYLAYYQMVLPKLKKGGIILVDNVLFHGQVVEENLKGKNALAIHAFNQFVAQDNNVEQVLLTIRDGLLMIRKK
jgi:caffeoyl-CoA O-methyltransferase